MRKVIYSPNVSLDNFVEDQNHGLDWGLVDEELHTFINNQHRGIDTFLFGRRMYNVMKYWDTAESDPAIPEYMLEFARTWKNIHKIVFSQTLEHVEGNATLNRGDIVDEVIRLKNLPGKAMSVGGATIAAVLRQHHLIDEYRLFIHPVIIGGGQPIFPGTPERIKLQLIDTHTFHSGVVMLCYQPI